MLSVEAHQRRHVNGSRPVSAPKRCTRPDRRPDLDKLVRSTLDALTTAGAIDPTPA